MSLIEQSLRRDAELPPPQKPKPNPSVKGKQVNGTIRTAFLLTLNYPPWRVWDLLGNTYAGIDVNREDWWREEGIKGGRRERHTNRVGRRGTEKRGFGRGDQGSGEEVCKK